MYKGLALFKTASALANHASARHTVVARNIANADTPGYTARDTVAFADTVRKTIPAGTLRATRSGHQTASITPAVERATSVEQPGNASPNGNSVSLESEMVKASEARQQHQLALSVYRSGIDLLRTGMGRGR